MALRVVASRAGGATFRDSKRLKPPWRGWGWAPGRVALATGLRLVGGLSPPRCCLREGGNAASRLTLTVTLGEEKPLGCDEYFLPEMLGSYFPLLYFNATPWIWMARFEAEKWG